MPGGRQSPRRSGKLIPRQAPSVDLTSSGHDGFASLSGERVVDIARRTLDASERMVGAWDELEPIVRALTKKVRRYADQDATDMELAAKLLGQVATVASKVGAAATAVMRAGEGQTRLAVLLEGPGIQRPAAKAQTEKQLLTSMIAIFRQVKRDTGICPACSVTTETTATKPAQPNGKDAEADG